MNNYGYASAPSNIALIKYWGKTQEKLPINPTISMTLGDLRSETRVSISKDVANHFFFNGIEFEINEKMQNFLQEIFNFFKFNNKILIETQNNFPSDCGIASSASGYAALSAALITLFEKNLESKEYLSEKIKFFASKGSGSAARSSILDNIKFLKLENGKISKIHHHESLENLYDFVICIDKSKKMIPSSIGHMHANKSIFQNIRQAYINEKICDLQNAISCGDFEKIQSISEQDTILMHSIVADSLTTNYLSTASSYIISELIQNRNKRMILWTADAGPNIHIIFNNKEMQFITSFLKYIKDFVSFDVFVNKSYDGIKLIL